MSFIPSVKRVNKEYDRHGKLSAVEYFYEISYKQRLLLEKILEIWQTEAKSRPDDYLELINVIRLALRTKEYSERYQPHLILIRNWYINYKNNK